MVHYRRNRLAGGTYFFTVNLHDRRSALLVEQIEALRAAVRYAKAVHPFVIVAWVVMPDHLHAIWRLPEGDADYSTRWRAIKATFTRLVKHTQAGAHRNDKGEGNIWQRRFWEHTIRDETDLKRHVDYIHYNPVKHGYVDSVERWAYSTIHRYRRSSVPSDWTTVAGESSERYGE